MASGDEYYEDLLKIALLWSGERNIAQNILYAACLGAHGATLDDLNGLAEAIVSAAVSYLIPSISSSLALSEVTVADWTDADGLTGAYPSGTAGGLTGDVMTDQVCVLVNEETYMRYRGGRGRIYLPQPDVTKIENGTSWTSGFVETVTADTADFLNAINALSIGDELLTGCLYHRAGSKDIEQGYEDIIGVTCSPTPGTQRRRVRRVGHLR